MKINKKKKKKEFYTWRKEIIETKLESNKETKNFEEKNYIKIELKIYRVEDSIIHIVLCFDKKRLESRFI